METLKSTNGCGCMSFPHQNLAIQWPQPALPLPWSGGVHVQLLQFLLHPQSLPKVLFKPANKRDFFIFLVNSPANPLSLEKNACIFCLWLDLQFVHVENIGALHNHNRQRLHRFFPGICRPSGVLTRHWKKNWEGLGCFANYSPKYSVHLSSVCIRQDRRGLYSSHMYWETCMEHFFQTLLCP